MCSRHRATVWVTSFIKNPLPQQRPARKADNLTAIFEPIVKVMWDP
jgi:hypothetical protein